jgi:hypothetical protein
MSQRLINAIRAEHKDAEILSTSRVLWHEWELDGWVALVKVGKVTKVFTTDHGGLRSMSLAQARTFMRERITENQSIVDDMKDFQGRIKSAL